jgi:undecaprenyl-diphosphatase
MTDSRPDEKGNQQGPGAQIMRILSGARREWPILLIFLLAAASVWIFIELAGKVVANDTPAIDHQLLELFRDPEDPTRPVGSPWFREMMRDFTGLGGTGVLTLITLSAVGFFLLERKDSAAALLAVAVLGGVVLSNVLKIGFGRPRPDLAAYEPFLSSASFPSGHSTMAAVVYLTIGALIARLHPDPRVKIYVLTLSVLITLIVGVTRVYLGVHWPTDVLAGWAVGSAWALFCWLVALVLQRRNAIEQT